MAEINLERAKEVFQTICDAFDAKELKYQTDAEKLVLQCGFQGEDLPISITMRVEPKLEVVSFFSKIPFSVAEDNRIAVAAAITMANSFLKSGCFDFDLSSGNIYYRVANSYRDCVVGKEMFIQMLAISYGAIENYNDKFMLLANGTISLEKFYEAIKK